MKLKGLLPLIIPIWLVLVISVAGQVNQAKTHLNASAQDLTTTTKAKVLPVALPKEATVYFESDSITGTITKLDKQGLTVDDRERYSLDRIKRVVFQGEVWVSAAGGTERKIRGANRDTGLAGK